MGKRVTAWELWALALLGIWLKFFRGKSSPPTATTGRTTTTVATGRGLLESFGSGALAVLHVLGMLMALGALVGLIALGFRMFMRRRRLEAMIAEEIVLGPDDVANPEEVVGALDAIHTALLTRYGGSAIGQVSWTFEIIRDRDGQIHFVIAAPHKWLTAIEDIWRGVYTNLRFQPWGDVPRSWPVAQQVVLERPWHHPTRIDTTYASSVVEMMVQAMDRAEGEIRLQWLLTPLPVGPLTAKLRGSLQQLEYKARADQQVDPAHPGLGVVDRKDVSQATALLGRSAFRAEVRLAADDWNAMQRIYGALAGSNAENQWKAQTIWGFRGLWTQWLNRRVPSIGFFGHTILFSKPLATVIHLPSARLRVQSLTRKLVRRGPAPPSIPRDPDVAIMKDEIGLVGIPEQDRKFNTLFVGSQGGGKSTGMLQQIRVDSYYRDRYGQPKAMVLIDIGKDTAKRAMGIIPDDRDVIWFDPADPNCPWTLNPITAGVHASSLANDVLEGLTQVFGDEAIRSRSREFLGNAILAVKEVHGNNADFSMVYKMLTDATFRQEVIDKVKDPHQRDYWQVTFTQTVANNPRFVEEGLAAPRNKLDEVLRNQAVRAALTAGGGRQVLNLHDIVYGRKVLVANLDKSRLGKAGARLLGVFLITMLWHALQTQADIPEAERVPTALVIDEAQNFISDVFLDILAEGRAFGAQTTIAVRFLGEILSDRAIQGVRTLVQNLVIYQFELREEAEDLMKKFMRTYSNMISPSDEAQDNINFGADDIMRLPKHHVICRWMVDGSPQQAFLAETIPWEGTYNEAVKQHHLAKQPRLAPPAEDDEWVPATDPDSVPDVSVGTGVEVSIDGDDDMLWSAMDDGMFSAGVVPAAEENGVVAAPRWLSLLAGGQDVARWWDAETGAGLLPLWERVQQENGVSVLWELEGLDTINPDWQPAVRRRAVDVARSMGGPDGVYAWVTPGILGCWLPPGTTVSDDLWQRTAAGRNVRWHSVESVGVTEQAPVFDPDTNDKPKDPLDQTLKPLDADVEAHAPNPSSDAKPSPQEEKPVLPDLVEPGQWSRLEQDAGLTKDQVLEWQMKYKATDTEIAYTVRWMLKNRVRGESSEKTFLKVLRMKLEDRILQPFLNQIRGVSAKEVNDVLLASNRPLVYWGRWIRRHPDIKTLDALRHAVQNDQDQRQAAP